MKAIPPGAGNILVGPHPGPLDPQLMFYLLGATHRGPAVFLMAAEVYFGGTALRRLALNRLGVIPVARGRKNPEAVRIMSELIASGWWGGIFPEGEVYFSRQVMPMEDGAIRIAVEAALEIQQETEEGGQGGSQLRPVFLTPFAHVYFFKHPKHALSRADKALRELESHPMIAIKSPRGDLPTRLRRAADRLLGNKADAYGIPREEWHD
ncbi:MAG: 1-acyl-sn-glycerol-3-phosphate acyltransferase, partial [bacterium]|nr:1-acyl-sn-glycerol-3-phosphate acyltransferase [bacterium]